MFSSPFAYLVLWHFPYLNSFFSSPPLLCMYVCYSIPVLLVPLAPIYRRLLWGEERETLIPWVLSTEPALESLPLQPELNLLLSRLMLLVDVLAGHSITPKIQ